MPLLPRSSASHRAADIFQQVAEQAGTTRSGEHHAEIIWLMVLFGLVVTLSIVIRIYMIMVAKRSFSTSDWLVSAALIPILAFLALVGLATNKYGFHRHTADLTTPEFVMAVKISFAGDFIYSFVSTLMKLSILFLYLQVAERSHSKTFVRIIWTAVAFVICECMGYMIGLLTACRPIPAFWHQVDPVWTREHNSHCIPQPASMLTAGISIAVMDFAIAFLPVHFFLRLQMAWDRKLALISLFGVGSCAGVVALVRSYYIHIAYNDIPDWTWHSWYIWVWTAAELTIGTVCACAPALKSYYLHCTKDTKPVTSSSATPPTTTTTTTSRPIMLRTSTRTSSITPLLLNTLRRASSSISGSWKQTSSTGSISHFDDSTFFGNSFTPDAAPSHPASAQLQPFRSFSWRRQSSYFGQASPNVDGFGNGTMASSFPCRSILERREARLDSWESGMMNTSDGEGGVTTSTARPRLSRDTSWKSSEMIPDSKEVWTMLEADEKDLCVKIKSTLEVILEPVSPQ